ncbi:hypothetical protein [Actinokineospora sp. NBRC 105648]|uniref:hypothetical protein n=1 Tax=Actinokineospora sp. NBRC 105648 TaxID=3032206 RepID=UPI0024A121E7|nr:hypothetical protein [Actinokineospora sp. NBRC 105648]GLZ39907.1 hypothetical protein Acsp05_35310 [Actinokineospora sp. NBRC 105648]
MAPTPVVPVAARPRRKTRNRRPYAVIGGLVLSFTVFTMLGALPIKALGLPDESCVVGLIVLSVVGLSLLIPQLERLLERPFARLPQHQVNPNGTGFGLGLGLGLLYVPCAGRCWRPSPWPRPTARSAWRPSR